MHKKNVEKAKRAIAAMNSGETVGTVAKRFGVSTSTLTNWRREMRTAGTGSKATRTVAKPRSIRRASTTRRQVALTVAKRAGQSNRQLLETINELLKLAE